MVLDDCTRQCPSVLVQMPVALGLGLPWAVEAAATESAAQVVAAVSAVNRQRLVPMIAPASRQRPAAFALDANALSEGRLHSRCCPA